KSVSKTEYMIRLDRGGVNDIDVSGAYILANLVNKSRELKKILLFCHIPPACLRTIESLIPKKAIVEELIKPDLDCALEWMEERSLLMNVYKRSRGDVLACEEMEFLL